jgi:hypothetical protein
MAEQGIRSTRVRRSRNEAAATEAMQGSLHDARTRAQVIGRIRPGVKVLTKAAQAIPGAVAIYKEGWEVGASFETIEKRLKQIQGMPKYPLVPKNVPWFRACREDWQDPEQADILMDLYAEQREGDKAPRLYWFPVVFTSEDLDTIFEESFEAWSARELRFWSRVDPGTGYVHCMQKADPSVFSKRGAKQHWGGRPDVVRRLCNPNDCTEFLGGECCHYGTLRFSIPGIQGLGSVELTFRSVLAKLGISDILETVQQIRGSWTGLHNGEPFFWLSKQHREVGRVDWSSGEVSRTQQEIITLSVRGVDLIELHAAAMQRFPALAAPETGNTPAPATPPSREPEPMPDDDDQPERPAAQVETAPEKEDDPPPVPTKEEPKPAAAAPARRGRKPKAAAPAEDAEAEKHRQGVIAMNEAWERFEAARKRLGWSTEDAEEWLVGQPENTDCAYDAIITDTAKITAATEKLEELLAKRDERESQEAGEQKQEACPF